MSEIKDADWCAAYPHAAADEIKRLETALRDSQENYLLLINVHHGLQRKCGEFAQVAKSVAESLADVQAVLQGKQDAKLPRDLGGKTGGQHAGR